MTMREDVENRALTPPIISVIVPVYNTENYLHRCIDSILAQTFTNFELLLIDDGSKDASGTICDEYAAKDKRVRVFHKENGGVSSARNLGLDHARGEWITFCDADDVVYPCWLANYDVEHAKENNLICQGFDTDGILENGARFQELKDFGDQFSGNSIDSLTQLFEIGILGYVWVKAFRLDRINKRDIRFDENIAYREDEKFLLDYIDKDDYVKCNCGCGYRYHVPNLSKKYANSTSTLYVSMSLYERLTFLEFSDKNSYKKYIINEVKDVLIYNIINHKNIKEHANMLHLIIERHYGSIEMRMSLKWLIRNCHNDFIVLSILKLTSFVKSNICHR